MGGCVSRNDESKLRGLLNHVVSAKVRSYCAKGATARNDTEGLSAGYDHFGTDSHETLELLGRPFIGAEKSVIDTAERLWEVEAKLEASSN